VVSARPGKEWTSCSGIDVTRLSTVVIYRCRCAGEGADRSDHALVECSAPAVEIAHGGRGGGGGGGPMDCRSSVLLKAAASESVCSGFQGKISGPRVRNCVRSLKWPYFFLGILFILMWPSGLLAIVLYSHRLAPHIAVPHRRIGHGIFDSVAPRIFFFLYEFGGATRNSPLKRCERGDFPRLAPSSPDFQEKKLLSASEASQIASNYTVENFCGN